MPSNSFKNFINLPLPGGLAQGATTLNVDTGDGARLPSTGTFTLVIYDSSQLNSPDEDPTGDTFIEIILVTANGTDSLTIARGQQGTTDKNHTIRSSEYRYLLTVTKGDLEFIGDHIADPTLALPVNTVTNDVTIDNTYFTVLIDATLNDITVTLPTAVGISGRIYNLKRIDNSAFTVTIIGAETIDDNASMTIGSKGSNMQIQSTNVDWMIL